MTIVEAMEIVADELRTLVKEYSTTQKSGDFPISVYAGYPPKRKDAKEKSSYIYALAVSFKDELKDPMGTVNIEIGFSIYDEADGGISLFNLMEHIRQGLLKKRTLQNRLMLQLDLSGEVANNNIMYYPNWLGAITAVYNIAQPVEEYDAYAENDLYRA